MKLQTQDQFGTYDLPLATSLVAIGHPIDHIIRESGGRAKFCFTQSEPLQEAISAYWKQDLRISPKLLFESLKFVKSMLYSGGDR